MSFEPRHGECPDWPDLVSTEPGRETAAWSDALDHFGHCDLCRSEALAADPLLLFRSLPAAELSADETEDLRQGVAVLRRSSDLEPKPSTRRWPTVAASIVLLLLVGWVVTNDPPAPYQSASADAVEVATALSTDPEVALRPEISEPVFDHHALPLFEEIGEPFEQVVQWSDETVSVVLVVDERFDV